MPLALRLRSHACAHPHRHTTMRASLACVLSYACMLEHVHKHTLRYRHGNLALCRLQASFMASSMGSMWKIGTLPMTQCCPQTSTPTNWRGKHYAKNICRRCVFACLYLCVCVFARACKGQMSCYEDRRTTVLHSSFVFE